MTREQINTILAEAGIDTATAKAAVSNLMNAFNEEKRNAVVEAVNKQLDDFKDWKSPDEYQELENKITGIQEEAAKATRNTKYQAKGLNKKWYEYADTKLKDSKDFDKDLETFMKENPELMEIKKPEEQKKGPIVKSDFGKTKSGNPEPEAPKTLRDALAEQYNQE